MVLAISLQAAIIAATLTGRVVAVADGDTLTLLTEDKQQVRVRLAEIDAPEKSQAYGKRARQALSALVFGHDVQIAVQTTDRYDRTVGRVYVGDTDVNAELVRAGYAWAYRQYLRDRSLLQLEAQAREAKRGIWADVRPVAPWEYRRARRSGGARTKAAARKLRSSAAPNATVARWTIARRREPICSSAGCGRWMAMGMGCRVRHCADDIRAGCGHGRRGYRWTETLGKPARWQSGCLRKS